jgi:hypothetical protein
MVKDIIVRDVIMEPIWTWKGIYFGFTDGSDLWAYDDVMWEDCMTKRCLA